MKVNRLAIFAAALIFASCGNNEPASETTSETKDTTASAISDAPNTSIMILDPEGSSVIDSTAKVENLAGGFSRYKNQSGSTSNCGAKFQVVY